jgi:hypothetical protein
MVEHVGDEPAQALGLGAHGGDELGALGRGDFAAVEELGRRADRGQRRAQVVAQRARGSLR